MPSRPESPEGPLNSTPPSDPDPRGDIDEAASDTPDREIARRAYERFQMRGGEHGHDLEDWLAAQREWSEHGGR